MGKTMGVESNGEQPQAGESIVRFEDNLRIGPYTKPIETEQDLEAAMGITAGFVKGALDEIHNGVRKPPVEDVGEVLRYMNLTHQLEFTFVSSNNPAGQPLEEETGEALLERVLGTNLVKETNERLAENDYVMVATVEEAKLSPEQEEMIDAISDLIDEDEVETDADLKQAITNYAGSNLLRTVRQLHPEGPTARDIAKMKAYLPAEAFKFLEAALGFGQTLSPAELALEAEMKREHAIIAAWHRDQQWLHAPLQYITRDQAWKLIQAGDPEGGAARLAESRRHERLKYEHMGEAIWREREARGIETNYSHPWQQDTEQAVAAWEMHNHAKA